MSRYHFLRKLMLRHKYQLLVTYTLFSLEMTGSLLRFYFFGEAINDLIKGSFRGLILLAIVQMVCMAVGTLRHIFDTRTYTAIYTTLVTSFLRRGYQRADLSKLSARSTLARDIVDFLEQDLVYVIEAVYNVVGSLIILFFYDKAIVAICMLVLIPVSIVSRKYGRKMNELNRMKNDELEKQVDIINTGDPHQIRRHYAALRKWQIRISNKEAWNFSFMEMMVLLITVVSLLVSKTLHPEAMLAGNIFGIFSYILKFASGLDTIPYTIQRISGLDDITRRLSLGEGEIIDDVDAEKPEERPLYPRMGRLLLGNRLLNQAR